MKITKEDYSKLKNATAKYLTEENWAIYQGSGLNETRFLFDVFHYSVGGELLKDLYKYLDDGNIYIALRSIWRKNRNPNQ